MSRVRDGHQYFDAVIVGAGLSGLYMLYKLRELGLTVCLFERGDGVGGTWYWNRFPGARCDSESMSYAYSWPAKLNDEWSWTERYASQPEILAYIEYVADSFDLSRDIIFGTRVIGAQFEEASQRWLLSVEGGGEVSARFSIMATGVLSTPRDPDFEGLSDFEGEWYQTSSWPHEEVDLSNKQVGIIGTGSTAICAIPVIAEEAAGLTVFQRTPNFSVPAWNRLLSQKEINFWKNNSTELYDKQRWSTSGTLVEDNDESGLDASLEIRQREFDRRWQEGGFAMLSVFSDLLTDHTVNGWAVEYAHERIRDIVENPTVADLLCPKNHPFGTKRLCVDSNYYKTYNRPNVTLVDISDKPIDKITHEGVRTGGIEYKLEVLVFATGFDAMTGALLNIDIRGKQSQPLRAAWAGGPKTYLGMAIAGFPNLFTINGPGSPSVLTNMTVAIEQHVDWISDCIARVESSDASTIEATDKAQNDWVEHVNQTASETLYPLANSWYGGANIPGKPRVFLPYVGTLGDYRSHCDKIAAKDYEGFTFA